MKVYDSMTDRPLRILSLDGGGVRGISTLCILKELMGQIAKDSNKIIVDFLKFAVLVVRIVCHLIDSVTTSAVI
jgi:hypothetical protein